MHKKDLMNWDFPEHSSFDRGRVWYIVMLVVLLGLLLFAVLSGNFLFAIILVLAVFIAVLQKFQEPLKVKVTIVSDGVQVGKKKFSFKEMESFWIFYEPPTSKFLYLDFKNALRGNLAISLEDVNPLKVREIMSEFLEENLDKEQEDLNETIEHWIKL